MKGVRGSDEMRLVEMRNEEFAKKIRWYHKIMLQ